MIFNAADELFSPAVMDRPDKKVQPGWSETQSGLGGPTLQATRISLRSIWAMTLRLIRNQNVRART